MRWCYFSDFLYILVLIFSPIPSCCYKPSPSAPFFSVALILQMFRLSLSVGSDGISFINLPALRLPRRKAMGRSVTKGLAIPRAVYCNLLCDVTISSWLE